MIKKPNESKKINGQCISYVMNRDNGLFETRRVIIIDCDVTTNLLYNGEKKYGCLRQILRKCVCC